MPEQLQEVSILDVPRKYLLQNGMVDIGEELPDVALQDPTCASVILGNDAAEIPETIHGFVRTLIDTA